MKFAKNTNPFNLYKQNITYNTYGLETTCGVQWTYTVHLEYLDYFSQSQVLLNSFMKISLIEYDTEK